MGPQNYYYHTPHPQSPHPWTPDRCPRTKHLWFWTCGKFPMDLGARPLRIKHLIESKPWNSRFVIWRTNCEGESRCAHWSLSALSALPKNRPGASSGEHEPAKTTADVYLSVEVHDLWGDRRACASGRVRFDMDLRKTKFANSPKPLFC